MVSSDEHGYNVDSDYNDDDQAYKLISVQPIEKKLISPYEIDDENFAVLTVEEIRKLLNYDVCSFGSVLSVLREVAILILLHFNWNIITGSEEWFDNEERIRESIGLSSGPVVAVSRLSGCLTLRCPDTSCSAAVGEDIIQLVSIENQKKYNDYLLRSYVENNKNLKWCPAPDCDNAIEYRSKRYLSRRYLSKSEIFDVKCDCSYSFCWNCLGEIHHPVDCDTVAKWNYKNRDESNNTEWIFANTKPCPKCRTPIEKNQGCMHMICIAPCYHEFCWLCLGPWNQGSGHACNKYLQGKTDGNFAEEERRRLAVKESIERYTHFYERWAANESSRKKSVLDLEKLKLGRLPRFAIHRVSLKLGSKLLNAGEF